MRVGVIGSGLAGLSAACTLAARGHEVEVFEKNSWLGGKAAQLREQGFRFDMGPTILIQPSVLRKTFAEAGKNLEDYVDMIRLDPQWRCFFEDGATIDLLDDMGQMSASLETRFPDMGAKYKQLMDLSEELHTISDKFFFWKSVGSIKDTFDVGGAFDIKVLRDVLKMRMGKTVAGTIREFIAEPNTAQMLDHMVQYVGSSPDASPAILTAIGHMQMQEGIWYPVGGTRAVPEALVKLATELGVRFHVGTDVAKILTTNDKHQAVTGLVTTDGTAYAFDAIVSNEDAVRTHRELLAKTLLPGRKHYAPMDASALKRYPILRKLGIFPVEMSSTRGAAQFLRTSKAILANGGAVWITPQGRFADPRETPLTFKPGLGALAAHASEVTLLPLAIEYSFWDERLPETLLRFGNPVQIESGASIEDATQQLEAALTSVMQELKSASIARDAGALCRRNAG